MAIDDIVPMRAAREVIRRLSGPQRDEMIECLDTELDPADDEKTFPFDIEGIHCTATLLNNGWTAVYRWEVELEIFRRLQFGRALILYDLLPPDSAIDSGFAFRP
jgi:hypothetical protein